MTIAEAAHFLGVTPNTLSNWERTKKITTRRHPISRYRLYKREDLESLLNNIKPD